MTPDEYLRDVLVRHRVDMGPSSPVLQMRAAFMPLLQEWAGSNLLSVQPSGSFAKGTAVRTGTDIDLFISLAHDTSETLQEIHNKLVKKLEKAGYSPRRQSVSIGVRAGNNTYDVDLVPAKKRDDTTGDHSLYHRKSGAARKTNIRRHVAEVLPSGRLEEIKLLKIWRNRHRLEFPSFYLDSTLQTHDRNTSSRRRRGPVVIHKRVQDSRNRARNAGVEQSCRGATVPPGTLEPRPTLSRRLACK